MSQRAAVVERPVNTRLISDLTEWEGLRDAWGTLHSASPSASTPLDFDWLHGWWQVFGPTYGRDGLRILTAWEGDRLVAALPLYVHSTNGRTGVRTLRFISTGESEEEEVCPDYLDLLHLPGADLSCGKAFWRAIARLGWDQLNLADLRENSPLALTASSGPKVGVAQRGICHVASLEDGFDSYLSKLSAGTRKHARQYLRQAERASAEFELAQPSQLDSFFDDLVRLHEERWAADGRRGCFAAARFTDFHRALCREWLPSGKAVLARLSHAGTVYGVLYGFVHRDKFDYYQSGFKLSDTGPFESPGTVSNLLLMTALAARGVKFYDFLRGSSPYKKRLSTIENRLVSLQSERLSAQLAVNKATQLVSRSLRKARRMVTGE